MAKQKNKTAERTGAQMVVGVIPARFGSTRLPGKSLLPICGRPLICWVVRNALKAKKLDLLLVATDDTRIADAVKETGVKAVMTRPDHPSGTDRIAEAVAGLKAEIIVNIQGDEPLIDPALVDTLVATMLKNPSWDMATAASPLKNPGEVRKSSVVKVVCDRTGRALYFSRSVIPSIRDNDVAGELVYRRHIGIYAYRKSFLDRLVAAPQALIEKAEKLEQLRALYMGASIAVVDAVECAPGVDTPEDVEKVERELKRRNES
jgi:3-deoxy-manno-octulosonate cytidylyltransferase (CMP-KDO synthetase)